MSVFHNNALIGASGQAGAGAGAYEIERSLRFNSADSAYLSRTPASAGNRKTWTYSFWVKRANLGTFQSVFNCIASDASYYTQLIFETSDKFTVYDKVVGGGTIALQTTQVFRDTSSWYHILLYYNTTEATASSKAKLYVNGVEVTAFDVDNRASLTADSSINRAAQHVISGRLPYTGGSSGYLSGYLADIHFIDGQALDPTSFGEFDTNGVWQPIAYTGSYGTNGFHLPFSDNSTAAALGTDTSGNGNDWTVNNVSVTGLVDHTPAGLSYRDSSTASSTWDQSSASSSTSAAIGPDRIYWVDLGASKSFNRITFSVVASGQSSDTSTNFVTYFSTSSSSTGSTICGGGCTVTSAARPSATTPGTITVTFAGFASQTGRYIGITNGSGAQGGTYTYSNFKVYDDQGAANDSLVDTPTSYGTDTGAGGEVRGNYCTWNPLLSGTKLSISNGNLDYASATTGAAEHMIGTFMLPAVGKWYFEVTPTSFNTANGSCRIGLSRNGSTSDSDLIVYNATGNFETYGITDPAPNTYDQGDIIGVAVNFDADTVTFYKNNVSEGSQSFGVSDQFVAYVRFYVSSGAMSGVANFGQRPFAYTAPSGFKALCTTNLPDPDPNITPPSKVMDVKLYTGNGSTQTISGLGFSPDLVWIKNRTDNSTEHVLQDALRGFTTGAKLSSSSTEDEGDTTVLNDSFGYVDSATSDGFTLTKSGTGAADYSQTNQSTKAYVAWCWDAGSSTVTNTDGSITSQVRANASAGFSVATFNTGSSGVKTVGHGLNANPGFFVIKSRSSSGQWAIYHASLGYTKYMLLHSTSAAITDSGQWVTSPTSSVFSFDSGYSVGTNVDYVAYCFAPVAGYSAFGSYTGNGSATDGPFVYTGFRPRWIMVKNASTGGPNYDWFIWDTVRSTYNTIQATLFANLSNSEAPSWITGIDSVSNGFKLRDASVAWNGSGDTFVYAAFAENPFKTARAR